MPDSSARRRPGLELSGGRVAEWRLRELMAARGLFSAVGLQQALAEQGVTLGASQAHELVTRAPRQPRMAVLFALCDVLECTLADLWALHQADARPAEGRSPLAPVSGSLGSSRWRPGWTRDGVPDHPTVPAVGRSSTSPPIPQLRSPGPPCSCSAPRPASRARPAAGGQDHHRPWPARADAGRWGAGPGGGRGRRVDQVAGPTGTPPGHRCVPCQRASRRSAAV